MVFKTIFLETLSLELVDGNEQLTPWWRRIECSYHSCPVRGSVILTISSNEFVCYFDVNVLLFCQ